MIEKVVDFCLIFHNFQEFWAKNNKKIFWKTRFSLKKGDFPVKIYKLAPAINAKLSFRRNFRQKAAFKREKHAEFGRISGSL